MTSTGVAFDRITAEIIRNGLTVAALEMSKTLVRTAYNPLLYEVQDFGLGIVSAGGALWAEAPGVTTFIGSLAETVKSGLTRLGTDGFDDGDVLIVNDPYMTGTHLSDTTVYVPIFHQGELVAFSVATAHWADIGGKTPGGWCPDSTDVYQEGLCFSHQKLAVRGTRNDDLWGFILSNVRFPRVVGGDLEAQIASCRQGALRVQALCRKYGVPLLNSSMAMMIERTDEAMRRQIADIPDGVYRDAVYLDPDPNMGTEAARIQITVTVAGDTLRVGFEGTSDALNAPVNLPAVGTRSSVRAAVKGLLMPNDPTNEGHFLAIEFDLPPGLVVSPLRPSPCDSYGYVDVCCLELVVRAMAEALPGRCPAGTFQLFGIYLYRVDNQHGEPFICIDVMDGGQGGQPAADGSSLIYPGNGDTPNTPIEVLETRYPVRCTRFGYAPGTEGAGAFRGGMGLIRDIEILEPGVFLQCAIENVQDPIAKGLHGGADGVPSAVVAWPGTERETRIERRLAFFGPFAAGDRVSVCSGGGGGWGHPADRDPARVLADIRNGFLSAADAAARYAVAVQPSAGGSWDIDDAATVRLRASGRADASAHEKPMSHAEVG